VDFFGLLKMEGVNSNETSAISHRATHKSENEKIFHVERTKRDIIPKSMMGCKLNEAITKDDDEGNSRLTRQG
jgi:hypothetical protein